MALNLSNSKRTVELQGRHWYITPHAVRADRCNLSFYNSIDDGKIDYSLPPCRDFDLEFFTFIPSPIKQSEHFKGFLIVR